MFKRLECVALYTANIETSIEFYQSLGLTEHWRIERPLGDGGTWTLAGMKFPDDISSELVLQNNPDLQTADIEFYVSKTSAKLMKHCPSEPISTGFASLFRRNRAMWPSWRRRTATSSCSSANKSPTSGQAPRRPGSGGRQRSLLGLGLAPVTAPGPIAFVTEARNVKERHAADMPFYSSVLFSVLVPHPQPPTPLSFAT